MTKVEKDKLKKEEQERKEQEEGESHMCAYLYKSALCHNQTYRTLQQMTERSLDGAGGMSVVQSTRRFSVVFHPQS